MNQNNVKAKIQVKKMAKREKYSKKKGIANGQKLNTTL